MMRSSVYHVLDKLNELEKQMDNLYDKADSKYDAGKTKLGDYYTREAEDVQNEIDGMVSCLKILGLNAWRECGLDSKYFGVWHIPLDDIERVC